MSARRVTFAAATVLALALTSSACTGTSATSEPTTPSPRATATPEPSQTPLSGRYVAIGDSYTAGPGISPVDPNSGGCLRSTANFSSLLAQQLSTTLVDVSCSGATTSTVTDGSRGFGGPVDPQLDALTADTDLVTVGLGGNDGNLFQNLIQSCSEGSTTCRQFVGEQAPAVLKTTTDNLVGVLRAVAARAPKAQIVLVGYLRLSPATGTCSALGINSTAENTVRAAETALDDALRAAADREDVRFVSLRDASKGHDACAGAQAWTNGATAANGDGIVFHPRPAGMRAVADVVAQALS